MKIYGKSDPEGKTMNKDEFLKFYYIAAQSNIKNVNENLENQFVRKDLVKLIDVEERTALKKEEMPRFLLSDQ